MATTTATNMATAATGMTTAATGMSTATQRGQPQNQDARSKKDTPHDRFSLHHRN
jgi:hypothetical protein